MRVLQFYITFTPTPHLDGKHVVFGAVEAGWSTLMMMEGAGSDAGNTNVPVTILDCRCGCVFVILGLKSLGVHPWQVFPIVGWAVYAS